VAKYFRGLTVELWRPAPDQTIKTNSPTQGDTQEKVPLLGSPTNDLLAGRRQNQPDLESYADAEEARCRRCRQD